MAIHLAAGRFEGHGTLADGAELTCALLLEQRMESKTRSQFFSGYPSHSSFPVNPFLLKIFFT